MTHMASENFTPHQTFGSASLDEIGPQEMPAKHASWTANRCCHWTSLVLSLPLFHDADAVVAANQRASPVMATFCCSNA